MIFKKPKVSVIVPVYNAEKYLRECLDSLVNQSFENFEIICVNDGSSDSSAEILSEYSASDKRIKIVEQENRGGGEARNNGLKHARGKYVIFLDSDDFFERDMLLKSYEKAEKTDAEITIFQFRIYNDVTGAPSDVAKGLYLDKIHDKIGDREVFSRADFPDRLMSLCWANPWTKFYNRKFVLKNKLLFPKLPNSEDEYFVYLSLCLADRITYLEDVFVNYRMGRSDSVESKKFENPLCFIEADKMIFDELKKRGLYSQVEVAFANRVVEHCNYAFWKMRTSPEALEIVTKELKTNYFPYMGVLDYPDESYENIEILNKLRNI